MYRKRYRDFKRSYDNIFSKLEGNDYCRDLSERKRELEKEKKKIQTEKLEYNRWLREEARDELIMEKIVDAIGQLEPLDIPEYIPAGVSSVSTGSWVLTFGDAHFGAELCIKGLHNNVINEYSPEIFYKRMEKLLDEAIHMVKVYNIDTLYVFDLGDQIDGLLRVGQLIKLRYGVVEATIKYAHWLSEWLNELSKHCNVVFRQTNGNHSELRMLGQKKGTFEDDNMGKVIYEFVKLRLADNPNVDINENETGYIFENIQGFNVLGYHGESKALETTMKDFEKIYGDRIDILVAGHLHHSYSETVASCSDVMRTPSIIGIDDYSMKLHKTSNPGATMFLIQRDKGKILDYHIKL